MANANDNIDDGALQKIALESLIRRYASNVTELRFGKSIKLFYSNTFLGHGGWKLLVEGPVGGHAMNFSDGYLYGTQAPGVDTFKDSNFYTTNLDQAIQMAEALMENLDEEQRVVDPRRAFISRFLNPVTFERQAAYWASDECSIGAVKAR